MIFTGERFIPNDALLKDEIGYEHLHRYHSIAKLVKDKIVLDIACGVGYGSAIIAEHASNVTGVDIDEESIKWAKEQYVASRNLQFNFGSVDAIPYSNNMFDVVISFETIEHLNQATQELFMQEIKRVLRPGGILVMSTPDKKNYSERYDHHNPFHLHEFYREEFADFLKKYFINLSFFEQGHEVVGIVSNSRTEGNSNINVINWQKDSDEKEIMRKYIIAVASDNILPDECNSLASIITKVDKDYLTLMDRLILMNKEIENLGAWGNKLNNEMKEHQLKIESQNQTISLQVESIQTTAQELSFLKSLLETKEAEQAIEIQNLTNSNNYNKKEKDKAIAQNALLVKELEIKEERIAEIIELLDKSKTTAAEKLQKINVRDLKIQQQNNSILSLNETIKTAFEEKNELKQKLFEKEFLIDELSQKVHRLYQEANITKGRLSEIYDSDGWRLLSKYYTLKGRLLPEHSTRYKRLKKIFNALRNKNSIKANVTINDGINIVETPLKNSIDKPPVIFDRLILPLYDHPAVSIIIPAHNAWEMNYQCINSIIVNTYGVAYEVILADDCSTDSTKECTEIVTNLVHIRNEKNLGFLKNCNNASKSAKGKYVLFLNNDTKVNPNWLSPLVTLIESDASIGMVGSKLIYPDGRLQEAGGIIWNDSSGWNYGHNQNPDLPEFNYVKEVDYISGACIMISKKVWEKLEGFDERYSPAYCEDSDFAFALRSIGYKVMYQPLSEIVHYEGYSHGTDVSLHDNTPNIKSFQKINNQKLHEKWREILSKDHFPNAQNVFKARDKSMRKKTMLVIDHYVPHFDQDAGSKTTLQYLELFTSLGLNIKFLGDNFFKHEPYTTVLQQLGIEVLYGVWYRDNWQQWIKDNCEHIDFVFINRPHISIKYIDFIKKFTKSIVLYYGHDLHFVREQMQYEIQKDPKLLDSAMKWKKTEMYLFEKSDIILTPSEAEKNIIKSLNPSFRVESILPYFFKKQAIAITNFSERKNILFVGGFTHLPNLDAVEWFCREVWPLVISKLPGVKFIVVGSNPPQSINNLQSENIIIKGFVSEQELQSIYEESKIVVVPLRYGAGVKGKTVEALYNGLPIVTTNFGLEGMPGNYSFIRPYTEPVEFSNELLRLYNDAHLLESMSLSETSYINQYFTYDAAAIQMKEMLNRN